jgi:serine/threonine protein kinase
MTNASGASGAWIADYLLHEELPSRTAELAYRATHRVLPRSARVTILHPGFVGFRVAEVQLMREACVLETLHHSGVPRVFECGVHDRRPWVATEHIAGTSIEQAAAERPLPIGEALAVVRDAAAVLAHAHRRSVVHRNLTPGSIVCTATRAFPVCITEWSDAAVQDRALPRSSDPAARFYRAPEVVESERCDPPSDVFALGAVMFEAATLVLPEPVQRFPGVPAAFHQLLASMLAPDPGDRPTAAAVHAEATRLAELYNDGAPIEEVEVELVDISRTQPAMPNLGWMPPDRDAASQAQGSQRRRRDS